MGVWRKLGGGCVRVCVAPPAFRAPRPSLPPTHPLAPLAHQSAHPFLCPCSTQSTHTSVPTPPTAHSLIQVVSGRKVHPPPPSSPHAHQPAHSFFVPAPLTRLFQPLSYRPHTHTLIQVMSTVKVQPPPPPHAHYS